MRLSMLVRYSYCIAVVGLSLLAAPVLAVSVEDLPTPKPNGWVNDTVDLLSPATEAEINRQVTQLEARNQSEIIVLTVADTAPYASPREFGLKWFDRWKIGKKGLDNGVLFLYSQKENRLEIVTGWGVMDIFPDEQVATLLKQTIRPKINAGQYNAAMLLGTENIIQVLQAYVPQPRQRTTTQSQSSPGSAAQLQSSSTAERTEKSAQFGSVLLLIIAIIVVRNLSRKPQPRRSYSSSSSDYGNYSSSDSNDYGSSYNGGSYDGSDSGSDSGSDGGGGGGD